MTIFLYDITTDQDRPITQIDVDKLQRTGHAFGELVKKLKFHIAEVRTGLVGAGRAISEIDYALQEAVNTAETFDIEAKMQTGTRKVLVIER